MAPKKIPSEEQPAISLVMPCYNRAYDLARALAAYETQAGDEPFELVAIDDASTDQTYETLVAFRPTRFTLRVERQERNGGPAAARNRGVALCRAPLILFVGDDILPERSLVRGHLAAHRRHPAREIAILGRSAWPPDMPMNTLMTHIDGIGAQQFSYHYLKDGQEYDFRHLYTSNISLKRDFLTSLDKWFDTSFPYAAFEDVELSYRLAQRGLRILYARDLLGYHYHYHNIWTFSTRQYRMGLMACVLLKKHPEIEPVIIGRRWPLQKLWWSALARLGSASPEAAAQLEKDVLHLLSRFEWAAHPMLDQAYLRTLNYFYYKGLIHGAFGDGKQGQRVLAVFAERALRPVLGWLRPEDAPELNRAG